MSSSLSCLAVLLSLLALASHLPAASATGRSAIPRGHLTAMKFLYAVNDVRRQAGAPPLEWSGAAARRAKQHATWLRTSGGCDDLAQKGGDPAAHHAAAGGGSGGAQTYFLSHGRASPEDAVRLWADERRWYDAGAKACFAGKQCGDYEIMVQPASKQLGCAVAVCASRKTIMVCEYYAGH
uniref:SCP domain-containing protein n=1 Tax=Oryza punctata TaxID=4537 RepID=A0A0E0KNP9_ORYPU